MEYNDIKSRLERVYSSIESRFEDDIEKCVKIEHKATDKEKFIRISFDNNLDISDAENRINTIIHNLANLKDNLKKKMINGQAVEDEINNSLYLQVISDLSNQEKHGYPLILKRKRSLKDPQVKNIKTSLRLYSATSGSSGSFHVILNSGQAQIGATSNCKISIIADIVDKEGSLLFSLDELIEEAMRKWEYIIKKYNIK